VGISSVLAERILRRGLMDGDRLGRGGSDGVEADEMEAGEEAEKGGEDGMRGGFEFSIAGF